MSCIANEKGKICDVMPKSGVFKTVLLITNEGEARLIGESNSGKIIWERTVPVEGINKAKS